MFQFQTGAIKRHPLCNLYYSILSFNSKLVRLKVKSRVFQNLIWVVFQFQTGAIKSEKLPEEYQTPFLSFNSKLVRLKAIHIDGQWLTWIGFNSKLVRLKVLNLCAVCTYSRFQFQTGAIKSL